MSHGTRPPGDGDSTDRDGRARAGNQEPEEGRGGMERLADLLPRAARQYGLEDQLEQAQAAAAWLQVVAERLPAADGACRLTDLRQGVATIEADQPIVAQELRLRSPELLAALRTAVRSPVRQLRVTTRHV